MLKQNARLVDLSIRLLDLLLLTLALPVAHFAYSRAPMARDMPPSVDDLWGYALAILILWIASAGSGHVYGAYRTQGLMRELGRIVRALAFVAFAAVTLLFLFNSHLPRLLVGFYFASAFLLIASSRVLLRTAARTVRKRGYNTRRYAIVGTGRAAEEIAATFAQHRQWGYQLAGYILADERHTAPPGGTLLGTVANIGQILDDNIFDEIVFALPREQLAVLEPAMKKCEEQGVTALVSVEPLQLGTGPLSLLELSGHSMLVYNRTPSDVLALGVKRAFDLLVSAAALLILSPVFLAIAVAIKLESKGPVFFRQTRVGLNGRQFSMVKFRSMYPDAEKRLAALRAQNEMSGPVFKMKNDPRITKVGKFIRKTSLDELPQFWNVLTGTMSIVGPRPPLPAEVRQYERWQRRRLSVRPGITCTWQVSGRNGISFEQWMELDLEYIDNWSLKGDLRIFFKTIPAVLSARGAS